MHSDFRAQIEKDHGAIAQTSKRKREDIEIVSKLRMSASKASAFASNVVKAIDVCGLPEKFLRIHWMDMNVVDLYYEPWRGRSMKEYCMRDTSR